MENHRYSSSPRERSADSAGGRFRKRPGRGSGGGLRYGRKKVCRFCGSRILHVDFKKVDVLRKYTTERGKILPRKVTGACALHQKQVALAVKRARFMAFLPYVKVG